MELTWHCHGTITDITTEESAPSMTENQIPQGDTATPFRYTAPLIMVAPIGLAVPLGTDRTAWED